MAEVLIGPSECSRIAVIQSDRISELKIFSTFVCSATDPETGLLSQLQWRSKDMSVQLVLVFISSDPYVYHIQRSAQIIGIF